MASDAEDVKGDGNAKLDGPDVDPAGTAPGNFGVKGRVQGGFQIERPQAGNVPTVNTNIADRYPKRVSLEYVVNGEHLVRPEYLEVILPKVRPPAASMQIRTTRSCSSIVIVALSPVVPQGTSAAEPFSTCQSTRARNAASSIAPSRIGVTKAGIDPLV